MTVLSSEKQMQLSGFLGQLPEPVAERLAKAVEMDRLAGGDGLPHEEILAALRPQLRVVPASRTDTPERLLCRPFEDLLTKADRSVKQKGRIARSSIEPVWNWLEQDLMPARHKELVERLRKAVLEEKEDDIEGELAAFWREASRALHAVLDGEEAKVLAGNKLGGLAVAEDAWEMALLLRNAPEITELQRHLPKPVLVLNEKHIKITRHTFDRLVRTNPDLAPYVPLIAMGRLERPWEGLRIAAALSGKHDDTVIASTDMALIGELLLGDLELHAKKIQSTRPLNLDSQQLLATLAAFSELSSGMVKELGIRRDGKWGQRLAKSRAIVSAVMEGLLERAPKEIFSGLPGSRPGAFSKGPKPLDIGRAPDPDKVARARRYAHLMVHSRPFAAASAFSAKLGEVTDETANALRAYNEDILRELRTAPPEKRAIAEQHFEMAVDLCKLILGEEEAAFLQRRSKVAVNAS